MAIKSGTYTWRFGMKADAQKVGQELEILHEQHDGLVMPQNVVDAARDEKSEMHPLIEWNDDAASLQYRRQQGAYILRNIMVVVRSDSDEQEKHEPQIIHIRALVNATTAEGRGYMPIEVGMSSEVIRTQILRTALSELNAWRNKYHLLKELAEIFAAIDEVEREFTGVELAA